MTSFRAAVLEQVGKPLVIDTLTMTPPGRGDVLVRLRATGLCHTDLEVMQGQLAYPMPIVLGHEGAGVVEAIGEDVTRVKVGDHVLASWNPHCGHCFYCERGIPILCEPFREHQPKGRLLDGSMHLRRGSETVHHFFETSTHAEYTMLPESGAIPIPRDIPFDRACIVGCGVMTGVGAVVRKAKVEPGASVLVIGCGAVGLNAIQGAVIANAGRIIAVEVSEARREQAAIFGATDVLDGTTPDVAEQVRRLTAGRGADYVFEAAGRNDAFRLSVDAVRPGGMVVWLGKINVDEEVAFRWGSLMGEKRIVRSSYGDAIPTRDFPWLARLYLDGKLKLDEMITARIPLEKINEGFAWLARGEGIRTVVELP
jgi:S-(hydroxymethyl)glutathione dehydrogenase/alcohol dehydrogenase